MSKDKVLMEFGNIALVQKYQISKGGGKIAGLNEGIDTLLSDQQVALGALDNALSDSESFIMQNKVEFYMEEGDESLVEIEQCYKTLINNQYEQLLLDEVDCISFDEGTDWEAYCNQVEAYAKKNDLDLSEDPFEKLMSDTQRIAFEKRIRDEFTFKNAKCDEYDYLIAVTSGILGGFIDSVFVGKPGDSILGDAVDENVKKSTEKFATLLGFDDIKLKKQYQSYIDKKELSGDQPLSFNEYTSQRKIQFLESKFKINYDQRSSVDTGGKVKNLSAKNHHVKSLAHSPDILGLFFSIVNQFTSTSTFITDGKLITINTDTFELEGNNVASKVFCGFVNWFGHIVSDMSGSNASAGKGSRGMGVPIPFYNLLQLINIGEFGQHKQTFAKIATQVFEQGYDFRHGIAMAVPVLITEVLTRFVWSVKQRFYHEKPWGDCIPVASNPELRRMLLVAHGSLCMVDTVDATIRSGGTMIGFMTHMNLVACFRFGTLALKEVKSYIKSGGIDHDAVNKHLDEELQLMLHNLS